MRRAGVRRSPEGRRPAGDERPAKPAAPRRRRRSRCRDARILKRPDPRIRAQRSQQPSGEEQGVGSRVRVISSRTLQRSQAGSRDDQRSLGDPRPAAQQLLVGQTRPYGIRTPFFGVAVGSGVPIYQQLVAQVRRRIAGGQLKAGDKLPTARDLAQSLTINPMTMSKAFGLLEAKALLVRQPGRAMVVAEQHVSARSFADRVGLLRPTLVQAAQESRELQLPRRLLVNILKTLLGTRQA